MIAFLIAFMVCAFGLALNAWLYLAQENPLNLISAIFCGALALWNLVMAAAD